VYRQLYQHCSEPLEPRLRLIALLGLGLVKPSTFTETHETEPEHQQSGRTLSEHLSPTLFDSFLHIGLFDDRMVFNCRNFVNRSEKPEMVKLTV
jgi:hypothetical protein